MMNKLKYYAFRVLFCTLLIPAFLFHVVINLPVHYFIVSITFAHEFVIENVSVPMGELLTKLNRYQNRLKEKMNDE